MRAASATDLDTGNCLGLFQTHPLAEEAERVLCASAYSDLRHLRCEYSDGVVSIRGKLPSFFLKQMAQTVVGRISGVRRVNNQIKVP